MLLVLVILGVIAAITMPTLNLSGNKEKALEVKAMKVLGDIDKALDLIKFNDSSGDLDTIYSPYNPGETFSMEDPRKKDEFKAVLAKYLKITNKPCNDSSCACYKTKFPPERVITFYLNNGACASIESLSTNCTSCIIPGAGACGHRVQFVAKLNIDVNGSDGPNQEGVDRFFIPLNNLGIDYSCRECNVNNCMECDPTDPNKCIRCRGYLYSSNQDTVKKCDCTIDNDGKCDCTGAKCSAVE